MMACSLVLGLNCMLTVVPACMSLLGMAIVPQSGIQTVKKIDYTLNKYVY